MDIQRELGRAEEALASGDDHRARAILRSVIEQYPQSADAWLLLADAVSSPEHAVASLERVLKLDPDHTLAHQRLAAIREAPDNEDGAFEPAPQFEVQSQVAEPQAPIQPAQPARTAKAKKPRRGPSRLELFLALGVGMILLCICGLIVIPNPTAGLTSGRDGPVADPIEVIYENIRASNGEDVERYMATIHSNSPGYHQTESTLDDAFGQFDLSYRVSNLEVIRQDSREAVVAFVLTTRKINGPAFRDNRVTGEMILRMEDGGWKIYDQDIHNIEYLN